MPKQWSYVREEDWSGDAAAGNHLRANPEHLWNAVVEMAGADKVLEIVLCAYHPDADHEQAACFLYWNAP